VRCTQVIIARRIEDTNVTPLAFICVHYSWHTAYAFNVSFFFSSELIRTGILHMCESTAAAVAAARSRAAIALFAMNDDIWPRARRRPPSQASAAADDDDEEELPCSCCSLSWWS